MDYEFTTDWLSPNLPVWRLSLGRFVGRPGVHALEIGSYEGRSAIWLLNNVLTGPGCSMTCIDPFCGNPLEHCEAEMTAVRARFERNVLARFANARLLAAPSEEVLLNPELRACQFDIIYIDGLHTSRAVLQDLVLSFPLLKVGGCLILDDFLGNPQQLTSALHATMDGVRAFLAAYSPSLAINHAGYQVLATKVAR